MRTRAMAIFEETGVLQTGHFLLTSGRHSDRYLQCARIFQYADRASELCAALAERFANAGVDIVVGPAVGAVQMAYEVSRHLNCRNFFTERVEGAMALRRGFTITSGDRVLVVEDAVTTGGTVREVIACLQSLGAVIVGVGCLVDRSGGAVDFGAPFASVVSLDIVSWEAAQCPLCAAGSVPVKPGSRNT